MNESSIVRYTAAELEAKRARGESRTDWERIRAMTDEELEASIADDPDEPVVDENVEAREGVYLMLDLDLYRFFRDQGEDWQQRMVNVLRAHQQAALKR